MYVFCTIPSNGTGMACSLVLSSFTRSIHLRAHNNNTAKVQKVAPPLGESQNAQSTIAVTRSPFLRRLLRDHAQTAAVWKAMPA